MFTGIVQGIASIKSIEGADGIRTYSLDFDSHLLEGNFVTGASVSIDGCCLTLVKREGARVYFDVIPETMKLTTLGTFQTGQRVNIERAARFGDEIGGHMLSGHVLGKARLSKIEHTHDGSVILFLRCDREWMSYIFKKGYIALNGVSLTVVDVSSEGAFTVHLIPETLKRTTFSEKKAGDFINIEIDTMTQVIVQTVKNFLNKNS